MAAPSLRPGSVSRAGPLVAACPRNARLAPRLAIAALLAALLARPVQAQEFALFGGPLCGADTRTTGLDARLSRGARQVRSGQLQLDQRSEGHLPSHHRDGQTVQFRGRLPLADRRLVLSAGVRPYRYFDTEAAEQGRGDSNTHGWGVLMSVRAAYYTSHRWIAQLQVNRVHTFSGPDTTSVLFGVGYQLDAPGTPGPRDHAAGRLDRVTHNEITGMVGETILNSRSSPTSLGASLEYRRGLRVVTRYDRDTDVIQAGIGYRF